jgi:hypothetical protein
MRNILPLPHLFVLTLLLMVSMHSIHAQQGMPEPSGSLGEFLNPDGTINLTSGFNGSLDARGWQLSLGPKGEPRFMQAPGDDNWDDRFGPPGPNGTVYAVAVSGTDLYIAGRFTTAGTLLTRNIARWSSASKQWTDLSGGLGGTVYALAVNGNEVYAGGIFMTSNRNGYVARWNATLTSWDILGDEGIIGVFAPDQLPGAYVYALAVMGNDLYIGGSFANADNVAAGNLVRWNRLTDKFYAVGSGVIGTVRAMAVQGSKLYVAGSIASVNGVTVNNIATYDTSSKAWTGLGTGINGTVYALALNGTTLHAGGEFTTAGGAPAKNIATWNGTAWNALGSGINTPVRAITLVGNDLYVGSGIMQLGNIVANGIARWNGTAWTALGIGLGDNVAPVVNALAAIGTNLFAGGTFVTAGATTAHNIAGWDGESWFALGRIALKEANRNGTNGAVFAVAVSGSDVYIGGDFTKVGGIDANYIARWNTVTSTWSALGTGIGGTSPFVRALAVNGSDLYVGGIFTTAGGAPATGIARWDGTSWSAVGGGVGGTNPYVFALAISGNLLYAGGTFSTAGGSSTNRIALWNGTLWSALGGGIGGATFASVNAIAISGPNIYAGGDFTTAGAVTANRIARWDGAAWYSLGAGVNAPVSAIAISGTNVYAGGEFTTAGGAPALHIAKWSDGAWSTLGKGLDAPVRALAVNGSDLYAGGEFSYSDSTLLLNHIARWNGSAWGQMRNDSTGIGVNGPVRSIAAVGTTIYGGGEFSIAGGLRANNIAEWNGRLWSSLGSDPTAGLYGVVLAVAVKDTNVYVGGLFTSAGGMRASGIVRWDGNNWIRMGTGVNGPVRAIAVMGNDVYVGGEFDTAGTVAAPGIARWDGSNWSAVGGGLGGSKPYAYALAASGDDLYVGGAFTLAGGATARRIARWNRASQTWSPLGSGIGGGAFFTYVTAIATTGSDVYVGGIFPTVGDLAVGNIARWNATTGTWSTLGSGINNAAFAIAAGKSGEVYVGGSFTVAGDLPASNIARWDGTAWSALGNGLSAEVYSLAFSGDDLFAGGTFTFSGAAGVNHIGRWTGSDWITVGGGVEKDLSVGTVYALATYPDGFYAGGDFTIAGGRPSYYFAHWRRTPFLSVPARHLAQASLGLRNWPNPFGSTTTIGFTLTQPAHTTLKIYTLHGEEIATLADYRLEAGEHAIRWDADGIGSGTYIYRVRSGELMETGKVEVLR